MVVGKAFVALWWACLDGELVLGSEFETVFGSLVPVLPSLLKGGVVVERWYAVVDHGFDVVVVVDGFFGLLP